MPQVPASAPPTIEAWVNADRRKELVGMRAQLATNVHLISPLTDGFVFDGHDEVMAIFASAFELLDDIEIKGVTGVGNDWVVHGTNRLGADNLEEIQWLHLDNDEKIDQITLFIRPAPAAISLMAKIGVPLSHKGVFGRAAGLASRSVAPLAFILAFVERHVMHRLKR